MRTGSIGVVASDIGPEEPTRCCHRLGHWAPAAADGRHAGVGGGVGFQALSRRTHARPRFPLRSPARRRCSTWSRRRAAPRSPDAPTDCSSRWSRVGSPLVDKPHLHRGHRDLANRANGSCRRSACSYRKMRRVDRHERTGLRPARLQSTRDHGRPVRGSSDRPAEAMAPPTLSAPHWPSIPRTCP